jgi:hypothetical protein
MASRAHVCRRDTSGTKLLGVAAAEHEFEVAAQKPIVANGSASQPVCMLATPATVASRDRRASASRLPFR